MSEQGGLVLRIERTFDAPAQDVFDAWTREEVLLRWFHADPDWDTPSAEVDLRVGGSLRVVMRDPAAGAEYGGGGEYTVIDPPHRLVFTWVWDDDPSHPQLIEVEFSERDGATKVLMISSGIPTEKGRDEHEEGWHKCFDNLDRALARSS
jgi:uncharacterized protein YndB with AHSA1/START domain